MKKNITIKDVAKIAGVSTQTISRIINNSDKVATKTRERILKIIEKEGFKVNFLAKTLRKKKSNIIIIFVDEKTLGNWSMWRSIILQELLKEFKNTEYKIMLSPSRTNKIGKQKLVENKDFELLTSGLADGAIIFDSIDDDLRINILREKKIPFVIFGRDRNFLDTNYVDLDNRKAGYIAADYLIKKGYKNLCFFLGEKNQTVTEDRVYGLKSRCRENKELEFEIIYGINSNDASYRTAKKAILEKNKDSFFISGDGKALGIYKAISELKIKKDIGIIGIDNIEMGKFISPALTTIDQDNKKFIKEITNLIINLIENNGEKIVERKLIQPRLIKRKT